MNRAVIAASLLAMSGIASACPHGLFDGSTRGLFEEGPCQSPEWIDVGLGPAVALIGPRLGAAHGAFVGGDAGVEARAIGAPDRLTFGLDIQLLVPAQDTHVIESPDVAARVTTGAPSQASAMMMQLALLAKRHLRQSAGRTDPYVVAGLGNLWTIATPERHAPVNFDELEARIGAGFATVGCKLGVRAELDLVGLVRIDAPGDQNIPTTSVAALGTLSIVRRLHI